MSSFLINFLIGVVSSSSSSSSSSDKKTWFSFSLITSSLTTSYVSSSYLSFPSSCQILSYATSKTFVYFLICSKRHLLKYVLTSSKSSSISIGSYSMSLSHNVALVLFSMAMFSQSLMVCKVSNSTLLHATSNSFHNVFPFATKSFNPYDDFHKQSPQLLIEYFISLLIGAKPPPFPSYKLRCSFLSILISLFLKLIFALGFKIIS